jgi:hypothetical protein
MKKFAIVDKRMGCVYYVYDSDSGETLQFGGLWGDLTQVEHMELPENLWDKTPEELILGDVQVQTVVLKVQAPEMKQAYDENKQPLMDADNNPVMIPVFNQVPQYKTIKGVKAR